MQEDLRAFLKADAVLSGLAAGGVEWTRRSGDGLPAVVLHLISGPRTNTMQGRDTLVGYLVQIDCWGDDAMSAALTARAVVAALDDLPVGDLGPAFIENERATIEPSQNGEADLYRHSLDVRVWAQDAA